MPADTNANGDIFGGWLLSQMDLGGGVFASKVAKSRTVTVAIEAMNFRKAVYVGDLVSVHANLVRDRPHLGHAPHRSLGAAPQGNAVDPGDRRQFHLRLDRRPGPPAGDQAGRAADFDVGCRHPGRASTRARKDVTPDRAMGRLRTCWHALCDPLDARGLCHDTPVMPLAGCASLSYVAFGVTGVSRGRGYAGAASTA